MIAPIISCIVITSCFSLVALSATTDNTFLNHFHTVQNDKYPTTFKRIKEINGTHCNAFLPTRFASISSGISTKNSLKDILEGGHHSFYEVIRMGGDGNCFFRAIAFVMHGDQNLHYNVRQNIVNYLSQNWFQFPEGTVTTGSKDFYLKLMSQSGEYATHIELICAAMLYKKSVYLYRHDNTGDYLIIDDNVSVINPNYTGNINVIHSGAYDAGHYDVLAPMK